MGEIIRRKKKTLWMRYVNFEKIKDILHLVNENNGKLRASELERLAIEPVSYTHLTLPTN